MVESCSLPQHIGYVYGTLPCEARQLKLTPGKGSEGKWRNGMASWVWTQMNGLSSQGWDQEDSCFWEFHPRISLWVQFPASLPSLMSSLSS